MLFKLQDALEEMESMKKYDNKPDYDRIHAKLECALLSLECCREEKEKLVGLLQEYRAYGGDEDSLVNNDSSKQLTVVNDQFRAKHLRSCMEQLDEELERMKNDNALLPLTNYDPSVQDLQRELAQLRQLAEALRNKKKLSIKFQRDIKELIKDIHEIKGKYVNVDSELKEMHDRYSQLSLQFAEVEGERQ
ncbi:hypothetical protein Tco_0877071 [Tanacetum coccineum]|uniref:Uncharacterized protein n=1 Tax=Tanacetum coccineum TaxID=301880 RepID=A0ABQ5BU35_9ASTR